MTEPSQTNLLRGQTTIDSPASEPDRARRRNGGEQ